MKLPAAFVLLSLLAAAAAGRPAAAEEDGRPLVHLESYKPLYFIMGRPDTKIELSFKVKMIEGRGIYLGYTQLMMWELFHSSPFFSDLNYNPEFFYRLHIAGDPRRWLDLGGFEHESNGKGGGDERSWNRTYLRYHGENDLGRQVRLFWSLQAWVPYTYNSENTDIAQYRGVWEANVTVADFPIAWLGRNDLTLRLYPGGKSCSDPRRGGQELTLRAQVKGARFLHSLVFQVFHGYGENLLDYRDSHWAVRAGIGF